jgi:hypothetical protein
MCGLMDGQPTDLPDAGEGICCAGAAMFGKDRCTCWVAIYDLEQQEIVPGLAPKPRTSMCEDCAYRPGSPERQGDPDVKGDGDTLDDLVASGTPFACHQGIRRPVAWRHPSGVEIPGHPAGYDPPQVDGIPYKADGTPADLCGGWFLRRVKEVQR